VLGKRNQALADYQKALSIRPDYYPIYGLTGALYFMDRDWEKATAMFKKAFAAQKEDFSYPLIVTLCYEFQGNEKGAKAYLSGVINDFSRKSLYYEMGRFYLQPHNDTQIFHQVMALKDEVLKTKMLFFLGAQYHLNGQKNLAQTVLLGIKKKDFPQLLESRLATWIVSGQAESK
jgi:tetratricopeptide (TPR) repeat protein